MKKLLFIIILLCPCINVFSQQKYVIVKLNSGTQITCILKDLNPTSGAVLTIAGIEKSISMSDIAEIKEVDNSQIETQAETASTTLSRNNPLIITDLADYPKTKIVRIGSQEVEFVLVRGGSFLMGFDGRGSLKLNSEPVHKVNLSSFYISKECINQRVANYLGFKIINDNGFYTNKIDQNGDNTFFLPYDVTPKDYFEKLKLISPVRSCTEAEWEYAARYPDLEIVYTEYPEVCADMYTKCYQDKEATNPIINVSEWNFNVIRQHGPNKMIYKRDYFYCCRANCRLVIPIENLK